MLTEELAELVETHKAVPVRVCARPTLGGEPTPVGPGAAGEATLVDRDDDTAFIRVTEGYMAGQHAWLDTHCLAVVGGA